MTPELEVAPEPQPQRLSEAARLVGVFFEPTKTFEDVAARPNFWVPLILVLGLALVYLVLFSQHVGWERMIRQQLESSSRATQLTPEQREMQLQMGLKFAPVAGYLGVLLGIPVGYLIWAAILLGIVKGILSAPVRFKQVYAAFCYAGMPGLLMTILAIVVMYMKAPGDFNLANPLVFNPGALLERATTSKFVYSLASSLDLFRLWTLILVGIGLKAAGGKKLSMGGAMGAVFVPWALWTLVAALLAGLLG
jgi:hypothetical protein